MNFKTLAIFFAGCAVGAFGARWYLKDKYEKVLEMELKKVNDELDRVLNEADTDDEEEETSSNEPTFSPIDKKLFKHEIAKQAYDSYFEKKEDDSVKMAPVELADEPFVISGNEFITDQSHEKATLTYYINAGILCEDDEPLDVPKEDVLGTEWIGYFHDGEDGVVYVRNNKMGVDYEVILDESSAEFVRDSLGYGDK